MLLVVGGQSRKVGKTSVVAGLIQALAWADWTAIKVTTHHVAAGWALTREESPAGDSGRFLAAGARQAWFLRSTPECLALAIPRLKTLLVSAPNAIVESNTVLDYLEPDLFLLVLDSQAAAMKASAIRHQARADAFVVAAPDAFYPGSEAAPRPTFAVARPSFQSEALTRFVAAKLQAPGIATRSVNPSSPV